jgi:hypothetical protein
VFYVPKLLTPKYLACRSPEFRLLQPLPVRNVLRVRSAVDCPPQIVWLGSSRS